MALTLNETLAAAQDSMTRRPIVELTSQAFQAAIPFEGQLFNSLSTDEENPSVISVSDGRMAAVIARGNDLIYLYTDTARTFWSEGTLSSLLYGGHASLCELANDNIGIFFHRPTTDTLYVMTISVTGTVLTGPTQVADYDQAAVWISGPCVIKLADDTYRAVYAYETGGAYSLMTRSSSDFASWSAEAAVTLSGLSADYKKDNPFLLEDQNGDLWLMFDYVDDARADGSEIRNIYTCVSSDEGASFSAPVQRTSFNTFGESAKHPTAAVDSGGEMTLAYHKETNVLHIDKDTTDIGENFYGATFLHFDSAANKLYIQNHWASFGTKAMHSVVVVDVATWAVEQVYTDSSSPSYTAYLSSHSIPYQTSHGAGHYVAFGADTVVALIDHNAATVTHYVFNNDVAEYGLTANLEVDFHTAYGLPPSVLATWVDASDERLYILFGFANSIASRIMFGYIDITESPDPVSGMYSWNEIVCTGVYSEIDVVSFSGLWVAPEADYFIIGCCFKNAEWPGRLSVWSLSGGFMLKDYTWQSFINFPYRGAAWPIYYDGHVYASIYYMDTYGQEDRYGLLDITLENDSMQYYRPSYATIEDYGLQQKVSMGDGRILMGAGEYGLTIFDTRDTSWSLINNSSLPGLVPTGTDQPFRDIDYDPTTGTIFAGVPAMTVGFDAWRGAVMFNETGAYKQAQYLLGEYDSGWSFSSPADLTIGMNDYDPAVAVDAADVLWSLWSRSHSSEISAVWEKDEAELDLTDYLIASIGVQVEWDLESPGKLSFSLSHGHLFDVHNSMSTLAQYLKKGRKIRLRFGEIVSDTQYWQNQGIYIITDTALSYSRGSYPKISVSCEDLRSLFSNADIKATEYFDGIDPDSVLQSVLEDHADLTSEEIDIPEIDNSHALYCQFIDQSIGEIIDAICSHFSYFPIIDMDGKFTIRKVAVDNDVDHVYTGSELIDFTPDDSYSDFTNRVVVAGEGRYYLEVVYPAEVVGTISGTVGWWGGRTVQKVWYSEDHEQTCRNPRLDVIESVKNFHFFMIKFSGKEYISDEDADGHWVEVTIEAPDLTGVLAASLTALAALGIYALSTDFVNATGLIYALVTLLSVIFGILSAVASYSYNIYAQPVGHEKQTFQAEANDVEFQRMIGGRVVTQEIEDPLCYEIGHCQRVADAELAVVSAQRSRVSSSKIAHLQDEVGDTITINHPYTGIPMNTFIAKLVRTFSIPGQNVSDSGGLIDRIEGWKLS